MLPIDEVNPKIVTDFFQEQYIYPYTRKKEGVRKVL